MKKNVRRGFTLPEILVTVTVIAVLAAVVVPAVTQYVTKGDAPASSSDVNQIRQAITSYVSDTRHYPTDFSDLVAQPTGVTTWKGPYFAGSLSGVSGAGATFISTGSNVTLGPTITSTSGYLTTNVTFASDATCQDLWNLDKAVDGSAAPDSASGNLQWTGPCAAAGTLMTAGPVASVTLRLTAIGS